MGSFKYTKTKRRWGKVNTSLNQMLEDVKWGKYKLSDLFEVDTVKSFDEGKLKLINYKQNGFIEFVGRTRNHNGVKGYIQELNIAPNFKNIISVSQIGTIVAQLRNEEWYASQNIFSLTPINGLEKLISLYVVSIINISLNNSFSDGYGNYPTLKKLKDLKIQLPTKDNKIDFNFMETFISELEVKKITELETYLKVSGLKDYNLTLEEQKALEDFESIGWGEFTFKSIFNKIAQGRRLTKNDQLLGNIPFVMAGRGSTGISNYISNPVASFPKNSITIDILGNTFYRDYAFGAGDDTGVYWNDSINYSRKEMLFMSTSMEKSLLGQFDFGKKLRSSQSLNFKMKLPTKDKQPDYKLMETLISAIQKQVIKDVVLYTDKKLNIAK